MVLGDPLRPRLAPGVLLVLAPLAAPGASDRDPGVSWDATITGVGQAGDYRDVVDADGRPVRDPARGSLVVDLQLGARITPGDELYALVSAAKGDVLKGLGGLSLDVNADDLESDLQDVSGWGWSHVLEAWYRRGWALGPGSDADLTLGIVDGSNYLDNNAFANDEVSQFMNSVFVAERLVPSHDPGAVIRYRSGDTTINAVWMLLLTTPRDAGGSTYSYGGLQVGHRIDTPWGEGNYRLVLQGTARSLPGREPGERARAMGVSVSCDQRLGEVFGGFVRAGIANDDPAQVVHDKGLSFGLNINGQLWGRSGDEVGIAYAYLDGAGGEPGDIARTRALESYLRLGLTDNSALTLDLQWVRDDLKPSADQPRAWVGGLRLSLDF